MTNIVNKYFSDVLTSEDYNERNIFYPPAGLTEIDKVEKSLSCKFPKDYVEFLCTTNGYKGKIGKVYGIFIQIEKVTEYTEAYGGEFFPWIIFVGTDGGNEMFVIDQRKDKIQFGTLPYIGDESDFIALGNTFEEFVKHLYDNDFWEIEDIR